MTDEQNHVVVERLTAYSDQDAIDMGTLMPYLSSKNSDKPLDKSWLEEIIASPYHDQIVARFNGKIVGIATVNIIFEPSYNKIGYLEAFVVDPNVRGQGIGNKIWSEIVEWCRDKNVRLDFTSSAIRQDAHRFYLKHGAVIRDTTVFRFVPKD